MTMEKRKVLVVFPRENVGVVLHLFVFKEKGHYGVIVKVVKIFKATAEVEYISPGWKQESVGDIETVGLIRLKRFVESLSHFKGTTQNIREWVKQLAETEVIERNFADQFERAW